MNGNIKVDEKSNKIIVLRRDFYKKSKIVNTSEYRELQEVRKDYEGFTVVYREIKKAETDHFKGLNYEFMEQYIRKYASSDRKQGLLDTLHNKIDIARAHSKCNSFSSVRNWFLEEFPDVKKFGVSTSEKREEAELPYASSF